MNKKFKFGLSLLNTALFPYFTPNEEMSSVAGLASGAFRSNGLDLDGVTTEWMSKSGLNIQEARRKWQSSIGGYKPSLSAGQESRAIV